MSLFREEDFKFFGFFFMFIVKLRNIFFLNLLLNLEKYCLYLLFKLNIYFSYIFC